jgi:hypothetical protein
MDTGITLKSIFASGKDDLQAKLEGHYLLVYYIICA